MPTQTDADLEGAAYAAATLNRNDPDYDASLHEMSRKVDAVGQAVASVSIIDGQEQVIALRMNEPRNRAKATETARAIGELFEAPVVRVPARADAGSTPGDARFRQPPKHTHYKEDRKRVPSRYTE